MTQSTLPITKLNLGSGFKKYPGYTNVDFDKSCSPDIVCNLESDVWPFEDNSITNVTAHHILEHLGEGYFHFMQEMYRVCSNGAKIDIIVPHHRHDNFANDPTHRRPITIDGIKMFSQSFNNYCIDIGDGTSKIGLFYNVDFDLIDFKFVFDEKYSDLLKDMTKEKEEQIQTLVRERNNVIIEVEMKLSVVK